MGFDHSTAGTTSDFAEVLDALQLSFDPFDADEQDDFVFYRGAQRGLILEQLTQLFHFNASVIVLAGQEGSGRTTMMQQLGDLCYESDRLCEVTADRFTRPEDVFSALVSVLGGSLSEAAAGEMMAAIRQQLSLLGRTEQGDSEKVLLLLDDAHLLDDSVLSALMSLLQSSGVSDELPLHMVMFGDHELVTRLDAFGLVDVILHDLALPLLSIDELVDYLGVKLSAAGWVGDLPFDDAELNQLFVVSGGLPGEVHDAARELLVLKAAGTESAVEVRGPILPVAHMFSLVVLVGVLLMAFFYKDSWLSADAVDSGPARRVVTLDNVATPVGTGAGTGAGTIVGTLAGSKEPVAVSVKAPTADSVRRQESLQILMEEQSRTESVASEVEPGAIKEPAAVKEPVAVQAQTAVKTPAIAKTSPEPVAQPKIQDAPTASSSKALPSKGLSSKNLSADEQYLLGLPAKQYVLQVMASGSESAVETFIQAQKNRQDLKLFTMLRSGQPWYVVVIGAYSSSDAAKLGVASLPSEQKKAGPWPRSVSDVHLKIREFRNI